MSRVDILCETDREMMLEFSRLCVSRLNNYLPLKIFFSSFQHFLDANVLKEIQKNRLIMEHAAAAFDLKMDRTYIDVDELFEITKNVDNDFIKQLSNPLFSVELRYDDFADIRKKRIVSLVAMVFDLLSNWQDALTFSDIVKNTFAEKNYMEALGEVLHLYNVETRMLSNSIVFYGPAGKIKDFFAEKLFTTMEKTARDIAVIYTCKLYVDKGCSLVNPVSQQTTN